MQGLQTAWYSQDLVLLGQGAALHEHLSHRQLIRCQECWPTAQPEESVPCKKIRCQHKFQIGRSPLVPIPSLLWTPYILYSIVCWLNRLLVGESPTGILIPWSILQVWLNSKKTPVAATSSDGMAHSEAPDRNRVQSCGSEPRWSPPCCPPRSSGWWNRSALHTWWPKG